MEEQEVNRMRDMALRYFEGHLVLEEEKILFNFLQGSDVNVQLFRNWEDEWFAVSQKDLYIENKWNRLSGRLQINQWQWYKRRLNGIHLLKSYFRMLRFLFWVS